MEEKWGLSRKGKPDFNFDYSKLIMKELFELHDILYSGRLRAPITIEKMEESDTQISRLHELLHKGKRKGLTDIEAKAILGYEDRVDTGYDDLTAELREVYYNNIAFTQPSSRTTSRIFKHWYSCYKSFIIAKLLLALGARSAARQLLFISESKASRYGLYDILFLCALEMRKSAILVGNIDEYMEQDKISKKAMHIVNREAEIEGLYYSKVVSYLSSATTNDPIAAAEIEKLVAPYLIGATETPAIWFSLFSIHLAILQLRGDHVAAYRLAKKCLSELSLQKSHNTILYDVALQVHVVSCALSAGELNEGEKFAKKSLTNIKEGTINWLIVAQTYFLMLMYQQRYEEAAQIYKGSMLYDDQFTNQLRETWLLYSSYLRLILKIQDQKELLPLYFPSPESRLSSLLNDVPELTKDKKGYNVSLLFLQYLYYLERGEYDKITMRMDALKSYESYHLRAPEHKRSLLFLQILRYVEKKEFEPKAVGQAAKRKLELMALEVPTLIDRARIEIMPYEVMWDLILSICRRDDKTPAATEATGVLQNGEK